MQVTGDQTIAGVKTFSSPPVVPNDSFSFAQLQNIPTGTILGRATADTGDVEALTAVPSGVSVPAAGLTGDIASARITSALNASGSAPIYACRAWVNFNGTGTVAIRASGNVSSITDNGEGDYTVNLTTEMPDSLGACTVSGIGATDNTAGARNNIYGGYIPTSSTVRVSCWDISNVAADAVVMSVAIFR